jgi:transcriptional regulator with XRE-family HTH domain
MEISKFSLIRNYLDKSQSQLGELMGVSTRTIQSFEQGQRNVPVYVERQMLLLLALKNMSSDVIIKPCWEVTDCPDEWKENCIVWELKARHFCWFLNGTFCQGRKHKDWEKKIELCEECKVYQLMIP